MLKALPRLVEKIFDKGVSLFIHAADQKRLKEVNDSLWTYTPLGFLPHGMDGDGFEKKQPIFLSTKYEPLNGAKICISVDPVPLAHFSMFDSVVYVFDESDFSSYRALLSKQPMHAKDCVLWAQNQKGVWEKSVLEDTAP